MAVTVTVHGGTAMRRDGRTAAALKGKKRFVQAESKKKIGLPPEEEEIKIKIYIYIYMKGSPKQTCLI